jgi:PGF-pre-PGF domain-containing protein
MVIDFTDKRHFLVCLLVLICIGTAPASASDWYVSTSGDNTANGSISSPWRTITYAVEENASVQDGDIIHIAAGTYKEWNIPITKDLILIGEAEESTIVDGMETYTGEEGGVFNLNTVTVAFEALTIRNGSGLCGGGLVSVDSILTISDCCITDNIAATFGGGIGLAGGTLTISGGEITGNTAYDEFGVEPNDGYYGGGGICAFNAAVMISEATIAGNQEQIGGELLGGGGGISQRGGSLTLSDCALADNSADIGGGICLAGVTSMISGCTIEENSAHFTFDNLTSGGGGGVFLQGGSLALVNSTLRDNFAGQYGGGMHAADGMVTISESVILDNTIEYSQGGGISQVNGTLEIQGSTIENNTALTSGGGVRITNVDPLTLSGTLVAQNSAMNGGGVYQELGTAVVTDTILSGNSVSYSGGGVFQDRGTMTISNSTLDQNTAGRHGGGVFQKEDGTLTITGATITGNTAQYGGGGVHSNSTVTIYNCNLRNNYNFYRQYGSAILNTKVTESTNIIGGPFIGGNYWGSPSGDGYSDTCADVDGDGFGDVPYTVSGATDQYPLTTPVADFTVDRTSGTAPLMVRFTNTAFGHVTSFVWDFDDGYTDSTSSSSVYHTFTSAGTYTVSLNVTDGSGYSIKSRAITVRAPETDGGPSDTALAIATDLSAGNNTTLNLDPSHSAFYIIEVTVNGTVKEILITARDTGSPGSSIPPLNGRVYQFIEVKLYKTTDDTISSAEIKFTVPLSWLEEEGFDPADIVLFRWHNSEWQALSTTFVKEENKKAYFTATSPGFSLFAIVAVEQVVVDEGDTPVPTGEPTGETTTEPAPIDTSAPAASPTPAPTQSPLLWAPILALGGIFVLLRRWH